MNFTENNLPDDQLLLLIKNDDTQAYKVLFDRYWKRLYAYAYKICQDPNICDDCVQDLFVSIWENRAHSVILNLEAYLFKALKYQVAKHVKRINYNILPQDALGILSEDQNAETELEYQELQEKIHLKITELPERCREVFILSRFKNKTNAEIALQLKISKRTVEAHISHALSQLRSQLGDFNYSADF